MTEDFIAETKPHPEAITIEEIREMFIAAGLPCRAELRPGEVWIFFEERNASLVFTLNKSGRPLTAEMPSTLDYDPQFACAVFDVFDSLGWSYEEN